MNSFKTIPLRFRVWDSCTREWVAPYPDLRYKPHIFSIRVMLEQLGKTITWLENQRYIISQDTGLKDKNGKSIYTGDIVEKRYSNDGIFNGVRGVCFYDSGSAEVDFDLVHGSDNIKGFLEEYEVVGNIWQNPELLEEK